MSEEFRTFASQLKTVKEMSILAICIKETYTWGRDGKQHPFGKVKKGHCYAFDKSGDKYWIDPLSSTNKEDLTDCNGFYDGVARGLKEKYFNEMFRIV